ncbi:L,D-transpeptidase family protein [Serinicoccus sp. CNJ-927]|uniref:L,D-transpeptidase family protein n=1 Tax=Serinicoccus sp. CNJ-927 TaxID=1904970 RepID=UPI001EDBB454|nr:L,D-transpeptidase family protein [Serinicoccus sp. CNJ-927]
MRTRRLVLRPLRQRLLTEPLPRRALVKGGAGLMAGAVVGGLQDDGGIFALPQPEPEPEPESEPVEPEPEQAEPEPEPEPEPVEPEPPAVLARGSGGEAVWALQEQLNATGYWCGAPDGGFGHLTQQAVWAAQKAHGLVRDAVVGPGTRAALETGYRPAPAYGGDHVEVHLASQLLLVVRGGATTMTLNTSTGNGEPYEFEDGTYDAHTPPGDFAVWLTHSNGWRDGELGEMYRPMFYSGNYAVHGSESIPPYPASHGCARVSVAAMEMIWAQGLMSMGSRVVVV